MKRPLIAATIGLLGAGAFLLVRAVTANEGDPPTARPAPQEATPEAAGSQKTRLADRDVAALREKLQRLDDEMSVLRKQAAERHEATAKPVPPLQSELNTPEVRAEQDRQWHAHMAEVDSQFQSEPADLGWAATTSASIRDVVEANEGTRGTLRGIECRSQTCKVEILDDGSGKVAKNLPLIVGQLGGALPSAQANDTDQGGGRRLMTIYMTRSDASEAPFVEAAARRGN